MGRGLISEIFCGEYAGNNFLSARMYFTVGEGYSQRGSILKGRVRHLEPIRHFPAHLGTTCYLSGPRCTVKMHNLWQSVLLHSENMA